MRGIWRHCSREELSVDRQEWTSRTDRLFMSLSERDEAAWLLSDTGATAAVVDRGCIESHPEFDIRPDSGTPNYHRVAFMMTENVVEARGLLSFGDLVAIPHRHGEQAIDTPAGLVACGGGLVRGDRKTETAFTLFKKAPVNPHRLMQNAPLTIDVPEDLDARADWFKKRQDADQ